MRIALTGGIACGKSLFARCLNRLGVETLDADDIVHELVPEAERRRLAAEVFGDPAKRKALEDRIHPLVRERLDSFAGLGRGSAGTHHDDGRIRVEIIPLLFECNWQRDYDIIICVSSPRSLQIERMVCDRGHSKEQAEARLAAQLPVEEKAALSDYVIRNDGSVENLESEAIKLVEWLKGKYDDRRDGEEASRVGRG